MIKKYYRAYAEFDSSIGNYYYEVIDDLIVKQVAEVGNDLYWATADDRKAYPYDFACYPKLAEGSLDIKNWEIISEEEFYKLWDISKVEPEDITYYKKGNELYVLGEYEEAIIYFDKAITINPLNPNAYYYKGSCLKELGHLEEAIQSYDRTLKIDDTHVNAYINKADTLIVLEKNLTPAIESYKTALTLMPYPISNIYYNLGKCYLLQEDYEKALAAYEEAISLNDSIEEYYIAKDIALQLLGLPSNGV